MRTQILGFAVAALLAGTFVACGGGSSAKSAGGQAGTGGGGAGGEAMTGGTAGAVATGGSAGKSAPADAAAAGSGGGAVDAGVDRPATEAGPRPDVTTRPPPDAAAAPDLGPFMATPCMTMGTELCEDFETGQIDRMRWTSFKSGAATVTVDGTHVHSGKFALHLKMVPGGTLRAGLTTKLPFPAKNDTFYVRIFMYVDPDLPVPMGGSVHQGVIETSGKNADGRTMTDELGFENAKRFLGNARYSAFMNEAFSEYPKLSPTQVQVPGSAWFCVEMMSDGHTPALLRQVWFNGRELTTLAENRTMPAAPGNWDTLSIGLMQYHPIAVLSDAWIDDIRISSQPIGCDH
jgi:hypothetical protein